MVQVSVVITSHDSGPLLERAIDSVLAQTYPDYEIIVVDDGSAIPQAGLAAKDRRIRFIEQPNLGVSVARNNAVAAATAPYVAFLDHDDEWRPDKLARQLALVDAHPDAAFWCSAFDWVWPDHEVPSEPGPITYHGLLSDQTVLLSSLLVRRSDYGRVGGQNAVRARAEDWEFVLSLAMDGPPPAMAPERLVRYHLHERNASLAYEDGLAERLSVLDLHARRARRREDSETLAAVDRGRRRTRELFAHQAVDAAGRSLANARRRDAIHHLAQAGRLDPRVLRGALWASARDRAIAWARTGR